MDLDTIRQTLDRILSEASADLDAQAAARARDLDEREAELAAAMELLAVDPRITAAFNDGAAEARRRVQLLIKEQLDYLRPCSSTALVLRKLSELVG